MTATDTIAMVVVTYDRVHLLRQCVEQVLSRTSEATREIVIWDNASTDGTGEYLDAIDDPRITVVRNERNVGVNAYALSFPKPARRLPDRARRRRRRCAAGLGQGAARCLQAAA